MTNFVGVRFLITSVTGLSVILGCSGCVHWTGKNGTQHMLVIGIGVISVKDEKDAPATVTRTHAIGMSATSGGLVAGYYSGMTTAVAPNAEDVRIAVRQVPFSPITIDIQKAQLQATNLINNETSP